MEIETLKRQVHDFHLVSLLFIAVIDPYSHFYEFIIFKNYFLREYSFN